MPFDAEHHYCDDRVVQVTSFLGASIMFCGATSSVLACSEECLGWVGRCVCVLLILVVLLGLLLLLLLLWVCCCRRF